MVDQLWMWVLDERTIITSFPKRYGFNKHDLSGVHRSIRERLRTARKNQIRSVYDLALIILDECSNTLFDRVKTKVSTSETASPLRPHLTRHIRRASRKFWISSLKPLVRW